MRHRPERNSLPNFPVKKNYFNSLYHQVSLAAKYTLADYNRIATSPERRKRFIEKATEYLLSHKFDGLDLMWDFSEQSNAPSLHKENILAFIKALMDSFETQNLLLTSTFIIADKRFAEVIDLPALASYFDMVHLVQKYNYVETWPGSYRVEDVLQVRSLTNLEQIIDGLIQSGVPASKIVLGVQFVGLSFHAVLDLAAKSATFRRTMPYNEVCRILTNDKKAEWEKFYDYETGMAIAKDESKSWRGILRSTNVIVYESAHSIANKVRLALDRKLAGAMAFPIEMDDFKGYCGGIEEEAFADFNIATKFNIPNQHNATHPLLKVINYAFELAPFDISQGRAPNKEAIYAANRINEIDTDADVTSKIPDQYKPLIPIVYAINDALVVGYDKMREKADLYDKDQTYKNLMFVYMMKLSRMLIFVLGAALFGRIH